MICLFDDIREFTTLSIFIRLLFAVICGGCIGLERDYKRRSAGFRTHILICFGSALTMLISQYIIRQGFFSGDVGRISASVVSGMGFIGAGSIAVSARSKKVKGLTTASGLWVCSIIGLSFGSGFFELGVTATIFVILIETVFAKFEKFVMDKSKNVDLLIEYLNKQTIEKILSIFEENKVIIRDMEISRAENDNNDYSASFSLVLKQVKIQDLKSKLRALKGIVIVEEI